MAADAPYIGQARVLVEGFIRLQLLTLTVACPKPLSGEGMGGGDITKHWQNRASC